MKAQNNDLCLGRTTKSGLTTYVKRYGLALVLTLGTLLLRVGLASSLQDSMTFAFSSIAIALSAGLGGLGPGLFSTGLSALLTLYWFIAPQGSFAITNLHALGEVLTFLVIGSLLSLITQARHRSRQQTGEQADRFRTLFERASLGKALVDPATGCFTLVNHKFCEITGYGEQQLLGMTFRHLTYPEDREGAEARFSQLVRGEIAEYAAERRCVHADGRVIWVEFLVTLARTADGQPLYVCGSIQDITRRKLTEEALRESEARYRQVIRSAGSAMIGVDLSGRITMYNGQAQQIFGYTEAEVLGQHVVGTIVPPCDTEGRDMRPYIADLIRHIDLHLYHENENLTKDGRHLWIAWTNRPILEPDGTLREIICVGLDMTERKRAEEALRLSEERFRATYEHAPVGIEQVGLDGRLLEANDRLCRLLGYTREEMLGKTLAELTHPDDRAAENRLRQQLLLGDTSSYQLEKRYLRKGGAPVWVRATASLTHQPHSYQISIIEDITMWKQAEALHREHSFLRQVIDAVPSMIFVKDWAGRFILANEALARCYGTSVQGVVGKADADFNADAEEVEHFWRDDHQVMSERREILIPEEQVTFVNGDIHWFSTIKVPLVNKDGTCDKVLGVASDITGRKRAEEALSQSEQRERHRAAELQAILEAVPAVIWVARDPQCELITGNQMAYDLLRLPRGTNLSRSAPEEQRPVHFKVLKEGVELEAEQLPVQVAARGVEVRGFESQVLFDDGSVRHLYGNATPLRDEQGRSWGAVGAFLDVTEHKAIEQALRQSQEALLAANGQLREADRRKDEFLAMLAHELRNPLAPIRNAVQILRLSGLDDTRLVRQRDIIDRQVSHMARLIEDLLDVSRITRGTIVLQKRTLDVAGVLAHAMETTAPLIEARRHRMQVTLPPEALRVEGDHDRLIQVVGNLLANAAKYTDEGGTIWLEGRRESDQAVISVRDSGMGIAPEMLPHVFELFAQADQSLARSRGGLGIGLTMVQKLVQLHGGTVEARSDGLGHGSEFVVRLPALADPPLDSAQAPVPTAGSEGRIGESRSLRILVVDDVIDSASSLTELLQVWGHEAAMAHDGPSAQAEARDFHPEVILLDLGLPGMDGYELARSLRAEHGTGMMLVALTGYGQLQDRETTRVAGCDHHLVKPVDLEELKKLLTTLSGRVETDPSGQNKG